MNDLRTAAQQALDEWRTDPGSVRMASLMMALEAALAEPRPIHECYGDCPTNPQTCPNPCNFEGRPRPVQEPVAVVRSVVGQGDDGVRIKWLRGFPQIGDRLYTAPPQRPAEPATISEWWADKKRKPLTEEEIQAIWAKTFERGSSANTFARAIEQAHGIKS